jgi:hypothetical protein
MSCSGNLASMRVFWFVVARVFRRGGLTLTCGKALASEEASKINSISTLVIASRTRSTGALR